MAAELVLYATRSQSRRLDKIHMADMWTTVGMVELQ